MSEPECIRNIIARVMDSIWIQASSAQTVTKSVVRSKGQEGHVY